ncbi:MAG: hypothetical protein F6K10_24555 [Moorea sp. SIO2B7]|nr:hypothetical protein [Moorena sp. SIO2B7]
MDGRPISTESDLNFGYFRTQGGCGNRYKNRCRRRARNRAIRCIQAHWQDRDISRKPRVCTREGSEGRVLDYGLNYLDGDIQQQACSFLQTSNVVEVGVWGYIYGDMGCGYDRDKSLSLELGNLRINCR